MLLASCAPLILINDNDYRSLSESQLAQVRPFGTPMPADSNKKFVVEITARDLIASFDDAEYTWVQRWVPHCKGPQCKPLYYYDKILQDNKDKGLQHYLISSTYDYWDIKKQMPYYSGDIYALKDARYGHNHGKNIRNFLQELIDSGYITETDRGSNMIFKGDSLIYCDYSSMISSDVVDSVISANQ